MKMHLKQKLLMSFVGAAHFSFIVGALGIVAMVLAVSAGSD